MTLARRTDDFPAPDVATAVTRYSPRVSPRRLPSVPVTARAAPVTRTVATRAHVQRRVRHRFCSRVSATVAPRLAVTAAVTRLAQRLPLRQRDGVAVAFSERTAGRAAVPPLAGGATGAVGRGAGVGSDPTRPGAATGAGAAAGSR